MKKSVLKLVPNERSPVHEALVSAIHDNYDSVIILGLTKEEEFCVTSENVSRNEALFLLQTATLHCLTGE